MAKLCFVVAAPMTIRCFLLGLLSNLSEDDIVLVADFGSSPPLKGLSARTRCVEVGIRRSIAPWRDLRALGHLLLLLRRERPQLVYSQTPKAGLLAMIAARVIGVPVRLHAFTGQVWATRAGLGRAALKGLDRVTSACASHILVDSPSQRQFLLSEGVVSAGHSTVIAKGSASGVDTNRFRPSVEARQRMRDRLGIPNDAFVFLFLGRLSREKGIFELAAAFGRLRESRADIYLLMVGPDEDGVTTALSGLCGVVTLGPTEEPEKFFACADVFCLPSHREGFGSVIIEAAACGVPSVGSRIYGISDAIVDGETGLLHEVRDSTDIERCMRLLIDQPDLRLEMGRKAMGRAREEFSHERVVSWLVSFINEQLGRAESGSSLVMEG